MTGRASPQHKWRRWDDAIPAAMRPRLVCRSSKGYRHLLRSASGRPGASRRDRIVSSLRRRGAGSEELDDRREGADARHHETTEAERDAPFEVDESHIEAQREALFQLVQSELEVLL